MPNTTKILANQFSIDKLARIPCDPVFLNLLTEKAVIKRPYDADEGIKKTNEFGEIVMTYPDAPIVKEDISLRIDPVRPRGELGLKIQIQGGEVFATYRLFFCGNEDIKENDTVMVGSRKYQVLLVEFYYDFNKLHHLECWAREITHI